MTQLTNVNHFTASYVGRVHFLWGNVGQRAEVGMARKEKENIGVLRHLQSVLV